MTSRVGCAAAPVPALVVVVWVTSVLIWWAFAFMPLPSHPPEWLTAARYACFGSMQSGLPAASGWLLLVVAPATFLMAMFAIWGSELRASLVRVSRTPLGRCLFAAVIVAVVTEGTWVAGKVYAARAVTTWVPGSEDDGELPVAYPRQSAIAPELALVDQHGDTISLARFRGRPVILTFVFAHCQTMCPMIVETLKQTRPGPVTPEVLLVTLDPWRDTPSSLPGIARQWDIPEGFHVLSSRGVDDALKVAEAYGVSAERDEKSGDITHPGLVFVVDREGRLAYTFNNPSAAWVREALLRVGKAHANRG